MPDDRLLPGEDGVREFFASATAPNELDANRIVARSRGRRLRTRIAAGAIGGLAIVGFVGVGLSSITPPAAVAPMSEGAATNREAGVDAMSIPIDSLNTCESTLAQVSPSAYGLVLDVTFPPSAPTGTSQVAGAVRLTNTSERRVVGTTAASPAITVSQGGTVVWHSNGPMIQSAAIVDLDPGESMEYSAFFTPVRCAPTDESEGGFREGLPALPGGEYQLSAALYFIADQEMASRATSNPDLVTGPLSRITLG
jgi:hypothetical protein